MHTLSSLHLKTVDTTSENKQNRPFNSHHLNSRKKRFSTCNDLEQNTLKYESKKNLIISRIQQQIQKKSNKDFIQNAIQSVKDYYHRIQICIQEYKNSEIKELLKLKQQIYLCWGNIKKSQISNKKISDQWITSSHRKGIPSSPFLISKNKLEKANHVVSELLENLKYKSSAFPFIGAEWIKLSKNKENCLTIKKGEKKELKWLQKEERMMNVSKIQNYEEPIQQSDFVSKRAFRELFPEEQQIEQEQQSLLL